MSNDQKTDGKPEEKSIAKKAKTEDASAKRIAELEGLLTEAQSKLKGFEALASRADELNRKASAFEDRVKSFEAEVLDFETKREKSSQGPDALVGDGGSVFWNGEYHQVIGTYRADNTFVEVKRGHCPEGVTLIAISKSH